MCYRHVKRERIAQSRMNVLQGQQLHKPTHHGETQSNRMCYRHVKRERIAQSRMNVLQGQRLHKPTHHGET